MPKSVKRIRLPNGEVVRLKIDDSWGAAEVRERLAQVPKYQSLFLSDEVPRPSTGETENVPEDSFTEKAVKMMQPDANTGKAAAAGVANLGSFGLSDEIAGVAGGLGAMSEGGDFSEAAERSAARVRKEQDDLAESNPLAFYGAGAVPAVAAGAPVAAGVNVLAKGAPAVSRFTAAGLAEGALFGAGEADEGSQVEGAVKGAAIGGVGAGLMGAAVAGVKAVMKRKADKIIDAAQADKELSDIGQHIGQKLDQENAQQFLDTAESITQPAKTPEIPVVKPLTKSQRKKRAAELAQTFKDEGEMADFMKREADAELHHRDSEAAFMDGLPPEVRNMARQYRPESPITRNRRVVAEAGVLDDVTDAIVATPEAKQVAAVTKKVANVTPPQVQSRVHRNKAGKQSLWQGFGRSTISKIEQLSPRVAMSLRKMGAEAAHDATVGVRQIEKFYDGKEFKALSRKDRDMFEQAVWADDAGELRSVFAKSPGLEQVFNANIRPILKQLGRDNMPRIVRNVPKLRSRLGRQQSENVGNHIRSQERKLGRPMNEQELSSVYSQALTGRKLGVDKGRRIFDIKPGERRALYEGSKDALIANIARDADNKATQAFYKRAFNMDTEAGMPPPQSAMGDFIADQVLTGKMNPADAEDLTRLVALNFNEGAVPPDAWVRHTKDAVTASTIGFNPGSTIQQIADLAPVLSRMGLRATVQALKGRGGMEPYDVGVREIAKELRTARGTAKLARASLKALGFDQLDTKMSRVAVNSSINRWRKRAGSKAGRAELTELFGAADAEKLVNTLQRGGVDGDVRALVAWDVGKIRPINRIDMPENFLKSPNGRLKYSLLSWTIKQLDNLRTVAEQDIKKGNTVGAVKKVGGLLALMGALNVPVGSARDWLKGNELDPTSDFVEGTLGLGMSGKYVADKLGRGDSLALAQLFPGITIPMNMFARGAMAAGKMMNGESGTDDALKMFPNVRGATSILDNLFGTDIGGKGFSLISDAEADEIPATGRVDNLKQWENGQQVGRQEGGLWLPHDSIEGGTGTLGYGHKLTKGEASTGKIKIGDEVVDWKDGLNDAQVEQLLEQDTATARTAVESLVKVPLTANQHEALTSLVYNVGRAAFAKSQALKDLNAGDMEGFLTEAYDKDQGFTKVGGKFNNGLYKRRIAEKGLFLKAAPVAQARNMDDMTRFKQEAEGQLRVAMGMEEDERLAQLIEELF